MNVLLFEKPMSEKEAAEALSISIDTLQRIRKRGEITYRKIGGRFRYTVADLQEYSDNQKVTACQRKISNLNSADSGSPNGRAHRSGKSPGSKQTPDRHAASALAQATFGKPK